MSRKLSFEDYWATSDYGQRDDAEKYRRAAQNAWDMAMGVALAQQAQHSNSNIEFISGSCDHVLAQQAPATIPVGMDANGDVVEVPNPFAQQAQPRCEPCSDAPHPPHYVPRDDDSGFAAYDCPGVTAPQPEEDTATSLPCPTCGSTESCPHDAQPEDALAELDSIASEAVSAHAPNIANRIGLVLAALRAVSQPTREQIGHPIIGRVIRYPMPTVGDCWEIADAVLALYAKSEAKP